jgi:hypothetical protein
MQILEGTLIAATAVLSAVAIVATFGAATPVVVGAFAVASASGIYGMSNTNEGLNNVMLGMSGDGTTAAMNPIRDTLFASNPNLYYTVGNASTMVCTLAVPVGGAASSAMKAGTSVVKAITVEGGKIALSSVAGSATTDAVYKKTNNQIFATIAGMGVGSLAYGGMTKYDTAKNLSGYHAKATVENVAKNANRRFKSGRELINNPPKKILSDVKLKEISNEALRKCHDAGLSDNEITNARKIKNGKKPEVDSYLDKSYKDAHLSKFEDNGCYKIISDKRGKPTGTIGAGQDDLFVIHGKDVENILQKANGDSSVIEKELAMPDGYLGENPYLIRADEVAGLRMANGNETNAWQDEWCPAGVTRAGKDEAIINPLDPGQYSYRHCFEDYEWKN